MKARHLDDPRRESEAHPKQARDARPFVIPLVPAAMEQFEALKEAGEDPRG